TRRQRPNGLGAHHHSGIFDDPEHLRDPAVAVADQPAFRRYTMPAERQFASGRDLQAHLVFEPGDEHPVALPRLAGLRVEQELGYQEEAEPLGSGTRALRPGQHHVQNVLEYAVAAPAGVNRLTP